MKNLNCQTIYLYYAILIVKECPNTQLVIVHVCNRGNLGVVFFNESRILTNSN